MTVRMVLSGSTMEADILVRRLREVPGVSVTYLSEEWSEATLYSVYAVEMDIGTYLRSELRELETEAEP